MPRRTQRRGVAESPGTQDSIAKRISLFALFLLIIFYVSNGYVQSRDNHALLKDQQRSLDDTRDLLDQASEERKALARIIRQQNDMIRALGGQPLDITGQQRGPSGASGAPGRPGQPGTPGKPGSSASGPSGGGSSPAPTPSRTTKPPKPTPKPSPSPSPSPTDEPIVCVAGICIPPGDTPITIVNASSATTGGTSMDATTVTRLLGVLVPLLVAVITKRYASPGLKATLNVLSAAIVGSLGYMVAADGGYDLDGFVNSFLNTFIVGIATYYGVYKPTGVTGTVAKATEGFGLGSPTLETDDKGAEDAPAPRKRKRK